MIRVAPSVLACDFSKFGDECRDVLSAGADWLHFDVMDGVLVPNLSLGIGELASIAKAVDAFYDVHLMIIDPLKYVEAFAKAGADMITFHIESKSDPMQTIQKIRACGKQVGMTLRPATPASALYPYLPYIDMVLVMTVDPGFGGQLFMADMCEKIAQIKEKAKELGCDALLIEVDGGIDKATAPLAVRAGADVLVAGSAVFKESDRKKAIDGLIAK